MQLHFSKKQIIWVSLLSFSAIAFPLASVAITVKEVPNPRQVYRGWVTDKANILSNSTENQLDRMISDLEAKNGSEIAVVTVFDTKPSETPKAFATELFNYWRIGKQGTNNGVLLLISVRERRVQIETGSGIQSILPDARTVSIIQTEITPRFKQQDFDGGTLAGTKALVKVLQNPTANSQSQNKLPLAPAVPAQQITPSPTPSEPSFLINGIVAGILLIIPLIGFLLLFLICWVIYLVVCNIFPKLFAGPSPSHSWAGGVYNSRNNYYRSSNRSGFSGNRSGVSIDCSSSSDYSSSDCSGFSGDCSSSFGGGESGGGGGGGDYSSSSDCSSSSRGDSGSSFGGGDSGGGGGGGDYSSSDCSSSSDSGSSFGGGDSGGGGGGGDW